MGEEQQRLSASPVATEDIGGTGHLQSFQTTPQQAQGGHPRLPQVGASGDPAKQLVDGRGPRPPLHTLMYRGAVGDRAQGRLQGVFGKPPRGHSSGEICRLATWRELQPANAIIESHGQLPDLDRRDSPPFP